MRLILLIPRAGYQEIYFSHVRFMFVDIRENSNKRIILFAMSITDHKTENSNTTYIILSIPNSIPIRLQTGAAISWSLAFVKNYLTVCFSYLQKWEILKRGDNYYMQRCPPPLSWADCGKWYFCALIVMQLINKFNISTHMCIDSRWNVHIPS